MESRLFDFVIFKGIRASLYQGSTDDRNFEQLLTYVHDNHTKKGTVVLLASPSEDTSRSDASMGEFLMEMGYEDLTNNPDYDDETIRAIREKYKGSKGLIMITDNPQTSRISSPELGDVGNDAVPTAGDFRILRRL